MGEGEDGRGGERERGKGGKGGREGGGAGREEESEVRTSVGSEERREARLQLTALECVSHDLVEFGAVLSHHFGGLPIARRGGVGRGDLHRGGRGIVLTVGTASGLGWGSRLAIGLGEGQVEG